MNAWEIKDEILSWIDYMPKDEIPNSGMQGVIIGLMNNALRDGNYKEADLRRRAVLAWIFRDVLGKPMASSVSTKELTDDMWWALCRYMEPYKDPETGVWVAREGYIDDFRKCWHEMEAWEREMEQQLGFDV